MNAANIGRVVIQKGNNPILELGADLDFLVYFALDPGAISLLVQGEE